MFLTAYHTARTERQFFLDLPALIDFQIPNGLKTRRNLSLYHTLSNITHHTEN